MHPATRFEVVGTPGPELTTRTHAAVSRTIFHSTFGVIRRFGASDYKVERLFRAARQAQTHRPSDARRPALRERYQRGGVPDAVPLGVKLSVGGLVPGWCNSCRPARPCGVFGYLSLRAIGQARTPGDTDPESRCANG